MVKLRGWTQAAINKALKGDMVALPICKEAAIGPGTLLLSTPVKVDNRSTAMPEVLDRSFLSNNSTFGVVSKVAETEIYRE